ncbi:MAG: 16S rRNA (adenine(1518)-N(6)/adenine(1519)-N(6))-dimethyltransferase RsmA [Chromatiales bacterium]|nr:16S rRNA (adenine(1518)-N(6)/adenine(1519)-N(6))-dimethyltransferase RsmA [Chromatiales bacterium]
MHRARKRFGQNFLHDQGVISGIVAAIRPREGEHLVEIGPGMGAMTEPLLEGCKAMDAVELDRDLIPGLRAQFAVQGGLTLHNADALKFDFCALATDGRPLRVVGNLPYNISTPLIFHLLGQSHCIQDMHFMLQQEVVDRLAAGPGNGDYGRLGIMVQYRCRVEKLFTVPPGAFNPPPKVYSAIVRLTPYAEPPVAAKDDRLLAQVVTTAFQQRRKTLRNNLKKLLPVDTIEALGIDPARRPETLTLEEYVRLADALYQTNHSPR